MASAMNGADWLHIWNEALALLAREAVETQIALALALGLIFIMFFEGVWAVFRLPRRAIFSIFCRPEGSRFQQAEVILGGRSMLAAFVPRSSQGSGAGAKTKVGLEQLSRNRKRSKRVDRRRFKATKPVILKNTRIEPWLLLDAQPEPEYQPEPAPLSPFRHPNEL